MSSACNHLILHLYKIHVHRVWYSSNVVQTVIVMQVLVTRFKLLHAQSMRTLSDPSKRPSHEDVPSELVPLMKGNWIGKPSTSAQQKRRFFQLSTDGSTLRWAWNKYVLLYYVEVSHSTTLSIQFWWPLTSLPTLVVSLCDIALCSWVYAIKLDMDRSTIYLWSNSLPK